MVVAMLAMDVTRLRAHGPNVPPVSIAQGMKALSCSSAGIPYLLSLARSPLRAAPPILPCRAWRTLDFAAGWTMVVSNMIDWLPRESNWPSALPLRSQGSLVAVSP